MTKRAGTQYGLGGTLVTLLIVLLMWWLNGGTPTGDLPTTTANVPALRTVTAQSTLASSPAATVEATTTPSDEAGVVAPVTTEVASATATAQPLPTATSPPNPTASPTSQRSSGPPGIAVIARDELPPQALDTLTLIAQGGPFPFDRDDITFQNREGLLPKQARGYYREYTVITPGESDRGARRIIAGEAGELYYTADHYASFAWIEAP